MATTRTRTRRPARPAPRARGPVRPGQGGGAWGAPGPVWTKAPFLSFRYPGILVALVGAAFLLAVAAAAGPLFLSSAGTAALRKAAAGQSSSDAGLTVVAGGTMSPDRVEFRTRLLTDATRDVRGLDPVIGTLVSTSTYLVKNADGRTTGSPEVQMGTRTGFVSHLPGATGQKAPGKGWWLARTIATLAHVGPGDRIELIRNPAAGGFGGSVGTVRVAGVYRDLAGVPETDYWSPIHRFVFPTRPGPDPPVPPPLLLTDPETFYQFQAKTADDGTLQWEFPLASRSLALGEARRVAGELKAVEGQMDDPNSLLGQGFSTHEAGLDRLVTQADDMVASVRSPIFALSVAGMLIALMVMAAAGVYAVHSRRTEFGTLQARGMEPWSMGGKVALEALLPVALGAAAGWAAAYTLVRMLGPASTLDPGAPVRAAVQVGALGMVALALLAVVVALVTWGWVGDRRPGRLRLVARRIPWEAAVLALAAAALTEILARGQAPVTTSAAIPKVDLLLPLFPILFVIGVGGLAVRGVRAALPVLRRRAKGRSHSLYLATRRLSSAPRMALLLILASVAAIGMLSYAAVLVSSVRTTSRQKAQVFVGSDAAITVGAREALPGPIRDVATPVVRIADATFQRGGGGVDLLAVDSAGFERVAFWNPAFAGSSLDDLMDAVSQPAGAALPAIAVGDGIPDTFTAVLSGIPQPVKIVGRARAFPGMSGSTPLVVADTKVLSKVLARQSYEIESFTVTFQVWVRGPIGPALTALRSAGVVPVAVATAVEVQDTPSFLSLTWTFGFLQALGVLAGLVALVGLLLYLQARQGQREVSYALAKRMGLSAGSHRRSVVVEILGMLLASFVLGTALAWAAVFLIHAKIDTMPQIPPGPVMTLPAAVFGITGAVLVVFALIAGWGVQARAERANVAEVMRLAG